MHAWLQEAAIETATLCGFDCLGWGKLTLTPSSGVPKNFLFGLKRTLVSEVVSWFDVPPVYDHTPFPVTFRRSVDHFEALQFVDVLQD